MKTEFLECFVWLDYFVSEQYAQKYAGICMFKLPVKTFCCGCSCDWVEKQAPVGLFQGSSGVSAARRADPKHVLSI